MIFRKEKTFWMKKKTLIALILLACMLLTACGSTGGSTDSNSDTVVESSTPEPVEAKADAKDGEDFRNNLAAGLNARLTLFNSEEYVNSHEFVDLMTSYINAELDALGKYEDYVILDKWLDILAQRYFNALDSQLAAMEYADTDGIKYREYFELKGYDERVMVLAYLKSEYGFDIGETYAKDFDEMTAEGDTLLELKELAAQQQPVRILTGSGMCDYTAELVNVTELDLSGSYISIYPMDENGEPYDTYGGAAGSWKPGESLDIYFMGTRELMPTTVGLSIELPNALKTDYMPLSFKEAGADFILKDAPCEAGDRVKFRFDSVSADSPLWLDGEASLFIWLEGEKTYDAFFAMLQDYVDHPENYTQEEAEKYTADTMPENLSWFLSFGTYCRGIGLDPDCAADILANPEDYYDSLSIFFPAANFTVEVYSSSGELVAEKPVFYENYAVGEKLRGTDTEQIHLYGLAPDTYTVVIKES